MRGATADLVRADRNVRALVVDLVTTGAPVWEIAIHSDLAREIRREIRTRTA